VVSSLRLLEMKLALQRECRQGLAVKAEIEAEVAAAVAVWMLQQVAVAAVAVATAGFAEVPAQHAASSEAME
jgi:hypothetical protein